MKLKSGASPFAINLHAADVLARLAAGIGAAGQRHFVSPTHDAPQDFLKVNLRASGLRVREVLPIDRENSQHVH